MTLPTLALGRMAAITRRFTPEDLRGFAALAESDVAAFEAVPEPLIAALFSYLLGVELPGRGTNYLKQEIVFHAPAPLGAPITATVAVTRLRPEKHLCDLETIARGEDGTVFATGRALVSVRDVGAA